MFIWYYHWVIIIRITTRRCYDGSISKCQDYTAVKEAVAAGIYPYFHALESGQDTEVIMEGRRTIMIGSNNYLGLTSDPRVIEAARKAL